MKSKLMLKIEEARGAIKNQTKYQTMVDEIELYATKYWIDECLTKRFGLNFIWEVVTTLNKDAQIELALRINNNYNRAYIHNAKYEFEKLKNELGV